MLKVLRIATLSLFAATVCVFAIFFVHEKKNTDTTYPEIEILGDVLEVSIVATQEDLLKGVTPSDGKDGDITSKVVVESISKFIEPGVCKLLTPWQTAISMLLKIHEQFDIMITHPLNSQ